MHLIDVTSNIFPVERKPQNAAGLDYLQPPQQSDPLGLINQPVSTDLNFNLLISLTGRDKLRGCWHINAVNVGMNCRCSGNKVDFPRTGVHFHLDDLRLVVPRTIESSTNRTFFPLNSNSIALISAEPTYDAGSDRHDKRSPM